MMKSNKERLGSALSASPSTSVSMQGPSLSYERKIRLQRYAENRARSCLGLVNESSHLLWKLNDTKQEIALFKPVKEWAGFLSAKAVVTANASFPHVLKSIYDVETSDKFKAFLRKVLGDLYLDAQVLETLSGTGKYTTPDSNSNNKMKDMYKQSSIKWWAIKSGLLTSKSCDFYVLEYIGIGVRNGEIVSCYLFQESLAEVGGMPQIANSNLERSQFDALICKFERLPVADYAEELVRISVAFQRSPLVVNLFRGNPAVEMTHQLAKGLRNLLEDPPEMQEVSVVKTSAWVKDEERQCCVICLRKFSSLFRRRHHCRTCGEVICWQCSSTIHVPSINFTDAESGTQILARQHTSIRICVKCQASRHHSKSLSELSNQQEFQSWITKQRTETPQAIKQKHDQRDQNKEYKTVEENVSEQRRRKSRIQTANSQIALLERCSQDLTGYLENEEQLRQGLSNFEAGNQENHFADNKLEHEQSHLGAEEEEEKNYGAEMSSLNSAITSKALSLSDQQAPDSFWSDHLSHADYSHHEKRPVSQRKTGHPKPGRSVQSDSYDDTNASYSSMRYSSQRITEIERLETNSTSVRVSSAWATAQTETAAVTSAFNDLMSDLDGTVHFMVIGFTTGFSADLIITLLRQLAPAIPYIGGTIARAMCNENAWISDKGRNAEGLVTLWGIRDADGIYSVEHVKYTQETAKDASYAAARTAYARIAADVDPGEPPAFIVAYACPLFVQEAIEGIRDALSCPIVGGCSSNAIKQGSKPQQRVLWIQISSNGTEQHRMQSDHATWTDTGIAFALCFPSVDTHISWFTGYQPFETELQQVCMGTITKATSNCIYEIDSQPAAKVYLEWLQYVSEAKHQDVSCIGFPRLGNLHPLGTLLDACNQNEADRNDMTQLISSTLVIMSVNHSDGSISATSWVHPGTRVLLMEINITTMRNSIERLGSQVSNELSDTQSDLLGCLMFLSAGLETLVGEYNMPELISAYREWAGNTPLLGMTTSGEIGRLNGSEDLPHYDAVMFSVVAFFNRRRKEYLYF